MAEVDDAVGVRRVEQTVDECELAFVGAVHCVADELFARLLQSGVMGHFCKQNLGDGYICHGAMQDLYALAGLNAQALRDKIREVCHEA